jgi:hypothetical protein
MARWWLISWTTYGTWVPGDERGYRTWRRRQYVAPPQRYARQGEQGYRAADQADVHSLARAIADEPVYLANEQIEIALTTMIAEIAQIPVMPAILSLGEAHAHWLCYFGPLEIRPTVNRVKAASTRELNAAGFSGKKPWTKGRNMRSKSTRREYDTAYKYVLGHRDQNCSVYEWPVNQQFLMFDGRPPTSRRLG